MMVIYEAGWNLQNIQVGKLLESFSSMWLVMVVCSFSVTRHDHEDIVYKVDLLDLMPSFQFPKRKLMGNSLIVVSGVVT